MELSKIKVGQIVEHDNGFYGKVKDIIGSHGFDEVLLEVVDAGTSCMEVGDTWRALPSLIVRVVKDVDTNIKTKVEIDVDINGLEELETLVAEATEALEILHESKPFKVDIQGIVFEGTPSQFEAFMAVMDMYKVN